MDDVLEFLGVLFGIASIFFIVVGLVLSTIFLVGALGTHAYCDTQITRSPNFNIQWSWFTGCQVETADGLWLDYGTFAKNENGFTIKLKQK